MSFRGRPILVSRSFTACCTVFEVLRAAGPHISAQPVNALDIEFRNAVLIGGEYEPQLHRNGQDVVLTLQEAGQRVLSVRAEIGPT